MNYLFLLADGADKAAGVFFGLGAFALILAIVLGLFWIWALIDALTNSSLDGALKLVWACVIFFLPFVGALAYVFIGRRPAR